jgi:chromosome partitioning protein
LVLAVANQKGGVGKTTTAINLGTALAAVDRRVLIVDLDPQGNASTGLAITLADRTTTTYNVLLGSADLDAATVETAIPNLFIAPSTVDLSGADLELADTDRRLFRLRDALHAQRAGPNQSYDYVLVDCPPSLSLLTLNAFAAADGVLVPLQCEFYALEGLSQLISTIDRIRVSANPSLAIHGIVLTMHDRRNNLSLQVEQDVRENLGDLVYRTVIPRNVRLSEAPSHGKPALIYDHASAGSIAYMRLAGELLKRERPHQAA